MVVCSIQMKFKKLASRKQSKRFDFSCLRSSGLAHQFREAVETELKEKEQTENNINQCFDSFQRALTSATEKIVPHIVPCMKQEWMTSDIFNLMEIRRKAKGDHDRYIELN